MRVAFLLYSFASMQEVVIELLQTESDYAPKVLALVLKVHLQHVFRCSVYQHKRLRCSKPS